MRVREFLRRFWGRLALVACLGAVAVLAGVCQSCHTKPSVETLSQNPLLPQIRVKLGGGAPGAVVGVNGAFRLCDLRSGRLLQSGDGLKDARFDAAGSDLALNGTTLGTDAAVLAPVDDGTLAVLGNNYRGSLRLYAASGRLDLVNCVDLDAYLASVVGKELSSLWPMECLKAQAVAARSFAVVQIRRAGPAKLFDLYDDFAHSQAYPGIGSESSKSWAAVEATRGVVLIYNDHGVDRVLEALYSSTCGGHTVAVEDYWPGAGPVGPLRGRPCPYCVRSPTYRWGFRMDAEELQRRLRRTVPGMGELPAILDVGVLAEELTRDGRVRKVSVWTAGNNRWPVPVGWFKKCFLPENGFKSDRFTVREEGGRVVIEGRGYGHGVGMCQYGAAEMASRGARAEEILDFYYPGSRLVRVY